MKVSLVIPRLHKGGQTGMPPIQAPRIITMFQHKDPLRESGFCFFPLLQKRHGAKRVQSCPDSPNQSLQQLVA